MKTINDLLKNLKFVQQELLNETQNIVYKKERQIISLNVQKLEDGQGADGNTLKNTNRIFTGRYSFYTNLQNPNKRAGELYNFFDTGDFLNNMQVEVLPNLTQIKIFSTGTGANEKALFFKGYTNLFGLDKTDTNKLNYEIILPELQNFINKHL